MRIGVILQYCSFRNDVRRLIEEFSRRAEVVLFIQPQDAETVTEPVEVVHVVSEVLENVGQYIAKRRDRIDTSICAPRVRWRFT